METRNSRFVAALLSILAPGLGQLYNGQYLQGVSVSAVVLSGLMLGKSPLAISCGFPVFALTTVVAYSLVVGGIIQAVIRARRPEPKAWFNRWYYYALYFLGYVTVSVVVSLLGTTKPFKIPAHSMSPSIMDGDRFIADLTAFRRQAPAAGELALFAYPKDERITYVKRVIGVPGDVIEIKDKALLRNGKKVPSEVVDASTLLSEAGSPIDPEDERVMTIYREDLGPVKHLILVDANTLRNAEYGPKTVPNGQYFVLGDNRDKSSDSRYWGFVDEDKFIGRPSFIWFSWDSERSRVRWGRIGKRLQ